MAAKPSDLLVFNTGGANRTTPTIGQRILGFVRGEKPASSHFNWALFTIHSWIEYLSDGALSGDHSIAGDLVVSGDIFHGAALEVSLTGRDFEFESQADPLTDTLIHPGLYRTNCGGVGYALSSALPVKVGDVITLCTVYYNVNGGGAMQPKLKRINLATGAVNDVWAGGSDNTTAGIESQTSGAIAHTVLTGQAYFVEVLHTGAGNRTHGCTLKYTRPAP